MTDLEDRLRDELSQLAALAQPETVHPLRDPALRRRGRAARFLAPAAAIVGVAAVATLRPTRSANPSNQWCICPGRRHYGTHVCSGRCRSLILRFSPDHARRRYGEPGSVQSLKLGALDI